MPAKKLQPLSGYASSEAVDINKARQIVGNSFDATNSSHPSYAATLWVGNTISRIVKNNATTESKPTWALRINGNGDVLCKRGGTGSETYFVWKGPASPSIDLSSNIPDLEEAVDLTDEQVLVKLTPPSGISALADWLAVYDMASGHTRKLQPLAFDDSNFFRPVPVGIDHEDRVVAVSYAQSGALVWGAADIHFLKSPTATDWKKVFGHGQVNFQAILAKNGVALGNYQGVTAYTAAFRDLKESPPDVVQVTDMWFMDADGDDLIVGAQNYGASLTHFRPALYHRSSNAVQNLSPYFGISWKSPNYAVGVSGHIVIGMGELAGGHTSAWKLDLTASP